MIGEFIPEGTTDELFKRIHMMGSSDKTVTKKIRVFVRREWPGTELEKERRNDGVTSDFLGKGQAFGRSIASRVVAIYSKKKSSPCKAGSVYECMHWLIKYK